MNETNVINFKEGFNLAKIQYIYKKKTRIQIKNICFSYLVAFVIVVDITCFFIFNNNLYLNYALFCSNKCCSCNKDVELTYYIHSQQQNFIIYISASQLILIFKLLI